MGNLISQQFVRLPYPTASFSGKTVIVTGSNTGLGKEAARHFARLGAAKLILAVRNTAAGEAAKKDIEATTDCDASVIQVWHLDLASYDSVRAFAKRATDDLSRVDVLLENAGVATFKWDLAEGHERTVTVNVLSTFLLALLMLPKLRATAKETSTTPTLTVVSSEVHGMSKFPEWREPNTFDALDDKTKTDFKERYPTSKLLEVLAVRAMVPRMRGEGEVTVNYLNPGLCHSELAREGGLTFTVLKFLFARTTEVGSRTLVAAAAAGPKSHGKYMTNSKVDDDALSSFVRSEDGKKASEKVWKELVEILEKAEPGVVGENL
ncbi:uncharacterized protein PV06_00297 [Exophiala oligosperma]|uniref:Uncharacterized protein n=2 Tax=Chaetothyriales TaxID=34395 RepID=A0A0D2DX01_9EURO|nr:uncharacterized protein PV06_00297 [Exophiala oligosperma]KAJ9647586.1 hypothetical protein H2204_000215 [Knufia peltigerae]KIW47618.1 hypothetical protein PV06_00297 [Exophiala oligosperma]